MPKFPFTNYHELNLDWILKEVKALFTASEENARTIQTYDIRLTAAEQTASSAATAATSAQQLADAAAANADNALSVAGTADAKADSALNAATTAAGAASGALTTAQEARQIAGTAQSAAADAGALANDASNAAAAAQQTADTNAGNIAMLQTNVGELTADIETVTDAVNNKADVIIDSASGNIASFADGADDMPIRSLVVNIEPAQDLHGYANPWPAGGGKNKLPNMITDGIKSGVSVQVLPDGGVRLQGTATSDDSIDLYRNLNDVPSGLKGQSVVLTVQNPVNRIEVFESTNGTSFNHLLASMTTGTTTTFNVPDTAVGFLARIFISSGVQYNVTIYPMIRLATESDATFAPYSNICPISGHTGASVTRAGVNVWDEEWKIVGSYLTPQRGIPVVPDTEYRFVSSAAANINMTNESGEYISYIGYRNPGTTFRTPSDCHYINFQVSTNAYGSTYKNDISINYPSTDTEYHEGHVQPISITFPSSAGTVYGGTLDVTNGVLTVDRAMATYTGDSNWRAGSMAGGKRYYYNTPIADAKNNQSVQTNIYSKTNSAYSAPGWNLKIDEATTNKQLDVRFGTEFYPTAPATLDAWKEMLNATPLQVFYELESPVTYQLTPQELDTLLGTNNIYSDVGSIAAIQYPADTKLYIDGKIAELQALVLEN